MRGKQLYVPSWAPYGWDVENHISTTNVSITFGRGQSSLAYRYNSNNWLLLGPVQWVDAGDISVLVAGSPSICVQRQNKNLLTIFYT